MHAIPMRRVAQLVPLLFLLSAVPANAQGASESLVVPAGFVQEIAGDLRVGELRVMGTLRVQSPGVVTLAAQTFHVGPEGRILAQNGAPGSDAFGVLAAATPGSPGTSLVLEADRLILEPGSLVLGGWGGSGGGASGTYLVTGGRGGDGGSVSILALQADIRGMVSPGRGGRGGDAAILPDAPFAPNPAIHDGVQQAVAGAGGNAGGLDLHGIQIPQTPVGPIEIPLDPPAEALGVLCDDPTVPVSQGAPGAPGNFLINPNGGDGGDACAELVTPDGSSGMACGDPGQPSADAAVQATGGPGGAGSFHLLGAGTGGKGGRAESLAVSGDGGSGSNGCAVPAGHAGDGAGSGSASASSTGGDGGSGGSGIPILQINGGAGGAGGDADADAESGLAGHGGNGAGGPTLVVPGNAGDGGRSGDAKASGTGGNGGPGGPGMAIAGDGGRGGNGGAVAPECVTAEADSGLGGNAGSPGVVGSNTGASGTPGASGSSISSALPGAGGVGGLAGAFGGDAGPGGLGGCADSVAFSNFGGSFSAGFSMDSSETEYAPSGNATAIALGGPGGQGGSAALGGLAAEGGEGGPASAQATRADLQPTSEFEQRGLNGTDGASVDPVGGLIATMAASRGPSDGMLVAAGLILAVLATGFVRRRAS